MGEPQAAPTVKGETEGHGGHRSPLTPGRGCQQGWKLTLEVSRGQEEGHPAEA